MSIYGGTYESRNGLINLLNASDENSYVSGSTTWTDVITNIATSTTYTRIDGFGLNLSGSNSMITKPFTFGPNMTFEIWYKTYTSASGIGTQNQSPGIMQVGNYAQNASFSVWDWSVNTPGSHNIRTYINTGSVWSAILSSGTYTDAQWVNQYHHIAMVFSGTRGWETYKLYVDTSLIYTQTITVPVTALAGGSNLIITGNNGGFTNNTYASIRIYNRALTISEISQNYKSQKAKFNK